MDTRGIERYSAKGEFTIDKREVSVLFVRMSAVAGPPPSAFSFLPAQTQTQTHKNIVTTIKHEGLTNSFINK